MSLPPSAASRPPASDVSAWVGLVGVVTLFGWVAVCRLWPDFAPLLGLPRAHERLSGPNAALMAVVLTGLAMAGWSVHVDKVHRNPSTGIDWSRRRPLSAVLEVSITKLAGLWATWALIGTVYFLGRWYWDGQYLFAMRVFEWAATPLFVLSIPYVLWLDRYLVEPRDHCWHFGAMLIGREAWDGHEVKKHWRAWIIKGFFSAFMISILPSGFANAVEADIGAIVHDPVRLGSSLCDLLFMVDVQIGTVGYLLTARPLDAHIRSGNPLLAGWLAALMCYPPFGSVFMGDNGLLQYEYQTLGWAGWLGAYSTVAWAWAAMMVALTGCYAWATVAFGIRFSNLTYRGVLTNGPYRFTRHPAYLAKNTFWWLWTMPFLVGTGSAVEAVRNCVFLGIVNAIYFWRAKTEEAHLLAEDPKYREYHAWMEQHGLITAPLSRFLRGMRPQKVLLQPAE
jgi:protein-S-isoprenylcysteine O-methyltransferase Ste14